jgi:hypothetical protein
MDLPDTVNAATITATGVLVAAVITATAALGTALASFVSSWLTNRTAAKNYALQAKIAQQIKHADFRQAWINDLRSSMVNLQRVTIEGNQVRLDDVAAFSEVLQILLRINPKDEHYKVLTDKISGILSSEHKIDRDQWLDAQADYVELCQKILKTEWDVLKHDLNDFSYAMPSELGSDERFLAFVWRAISAPWNRFRKQTPEATET